MGTGSKIFCIFAEKNCNKMGNTQNRQQLEAELDVLKVRFNQLDQYFKKNPGKKLSHFGEPNSPYVKILEQKYHDYETIGCSNLYLEYKFIVHRMTEIEFELNASKTQKAVANTVDFIGSIAPQHVSGRVYKVENGDGCGKFCLWFIIIDALIVLILYAAGVLK